MFFTTTWILSVIISHLLLKVILGLQWYDSFTFLRRQNTAHCHWSGMDTVQWALYSYLNTWQRSSCRKFFYFCHTHGPEKPFEQMASLLLCDVHVRSQSVTHFEFKLSPDSRWRLRPCLSHWLPVLSSEKKKRSRKLKSPQQNSKNFIIHSWWLLMTARYFKLCIMIPDCVPKRSVYFILGFDSACVAEGAGRV